MIKLSHWEAGRGEKCGKNIWNPCTRLFRRNEAHGPLPRFILSALVSIPKLTVVSFDHAGTRPPGSPSQDLLCARLDTRSNAVCATPIARSKGPQMGDPFRSLTLFSPLLLSLSRDRFFSLFLSLSPFISLLLFLPLFRRLLFLRRGERRERSVCSSYEMFRGKRRALRVLRICVLYYNVTPR